MINHGNLEIATVPLPSLDTLRLLYFGFIYRGKGIEDLLEALADLFASAPEMRQRVRLTLAGGTAAEMADVLRDQLSHMRQCGFDAFAVREDKNVEDALKGLAGLSVLYGRSAIEPRPLFRRR